MPSEKKKKRGRPRGSKSRRREQADGMWGYHRTADYIGIAARTLMAGVERGTMDIPRVKIGRLVRFNPESVKLWIIEREKRAAS